MSSNPSELHMIGVPRCPHCGNENVTFYLSSIEDIFENNAGRYISSIQYTGEDLTVRHRYLSFWMCGVCKSGLCGESNIIPIDNSPFQFRDFTRTYPIYQDISAPKHTPKNIADVYKAAVKNLRSGDAGELIAACIMARRGIEIAIKQFGGQGKNLEKKIDDLAARHIITPALRDWAHEIRHIGNEAAHDEEPVSREDAEQAVYFAEMLFTYLYTLPGMVAERRQSK